MYNPDVIVKTNQIMEFTIGTGYEVRQISFPRTTQVAPASIEWATRSGRTGTATGDKIMYTYSNGTNGTYFGYGISTTSL
jgi:hypothetical protein